MDAASLTLVSAILISGFSVFRLLSERNRVENLREQLDKVKLTLESLQASREEKLQDRDKLAEAADQVFFGNLVIQTANYFPIIAKLFLAIEHPEDKALLGSVHELIYNEDPSQAKEKLHALLPSSKDECDVETLQFLFSVINGLLHYVNETDGAVKFKEQLQEACLLLKIKEKLTDEDKKGLTEAMLSLQKESWLAHYQEYLHAFEDVLLG